MKILEQLNLSKYLDNMKHKSSKLQIQACTIVFKDFCRIALGRNLRFSNFTIFVGSIS